MHEIKMEGPQPQQLKVSESSKKRQAKGARYTRREGNVVAESYLDANEVLLKDSQLKARKQADSVLEGAAREVAAVKAIEDRILSADADHLRAEAAEEVASSQLQDWQRQVVEQDKAAPTGGSAILMLVVLFILLGEFVFTNTALDVLAIGQLSTLLAGAATTGMWLAADKLGVILDSLTQVSSRAQRWVQGAMALTAVGSGGVLVWALGELRVAELKMSSGQTYQGTDQVGVPSDAIQALISLGLALFALLIVVEFRIVGQRSVLSPSAWGPRLSRRQRRWTVARALAQDVQRAKGRIQTTSLTRDNARQDLEAARAQLFARQASLPLLRGQLVAIVQRQVHVSRSDLSRFGSYVQKAEWSWKDRLTHWWKGMPADVSHRPVIELNFPDLIALFADVQRAVYGLMVQINQTLGIEPPASPEYAHGNLHVVPPPTDTEQEM